MDTVLSGLPTWLSPYWVNVTVVRLIISTLVIFIFGRTVFVKKPSTRVAGILIPSALLILWVTLTIYLGSLNFFLIDENTPLPPPIAGAALIPIIVGYLLFQYWEPFRQVIFKIPLHWMIGLQAYRMTGGIFLIVYALGLVPGVFALTAGIGDFVTGALAIPVAYFVYKQKPWSTKTAIAWNYFGLAELIILIPFGLLSSPSPIQVLALDAPNYITSTWPSVLAPTFHVPLGILMHIYSFAQLRQESATRVKVVPQKIAWQLMLFSAIAITAYAALFYIATPLLTAKPAAFHVHPALQRVLATRPIGLYTHVIFSIFALLLGPFQFLKSLRNKHPKIHRWTGRIYLFGGILVGGLGGLYIAQFSFAGLGSRLGFSVQSILLLFSGYMAYVNIRRGHIQSHQEWMIRNYALLFGGVTLRIYIRTFFWLGYDLPDIHVLNAWLCWVPNLMFAEWLIHRIRTKRNKGNEGNEVLPIISSAERTPSQG